MKQIVVWPATIVGDAVKQFEDWLKEEGFTAKYLTEFKTLPDNNGGEGGRNDLLFTIEDEDISRFSVWRLQYGMRWWEDYLDNGNDTIVPADILEKYPYGWTKVA